MDYALIWSILVGCALFIYMTLDGFDLGIGILYPFGLSTETRNRMMYAIAPIWDTNETWLVFAAGGLYGVFPKAYVFIFNALYIPLISMLICLIFRGISFEFRMKSSRQFKFIWSTLFCIGSFGSAMFQGIILGQLIRGFPSVNGSFTGDYWNWYNTFNFSVAAVVILFYAFMGANFLIYRLEDAERERFVKLSKYLLWILFAATSALTFMAGHSINLGSLPDTFISGQHLAARFKEYYTLYAVLGLLILLIVVKLHVSLGPRKTCDAKPFLYGVVLQGLVFFGVAFLGWPYIVAGVHTIWDASSQPETQKLILMGAAFFLPLILGYSMYNFYIFRGKITHQKFYH